MLDIFQANRFHIRAKTFLQNISYSCHSVLLTSIPHKPQEVTGLQCLHPQDPSPCAGHTYLIRKDPGMHEARCIVQGQTMHATETNNPCMQYKKQPSTHATENNTACMHQRPTFHACNRKQPSVHAAENNHPCMQRKTTFHACNRKQPSMHATNANHRSMHATETNHPCMQQETTIHECNRKQPICIQKSKASMHATQLASKHLDAAWFAIFIFHKFHRSHCPDTCVKWHK